MITYILPCAGSGSRLGLPYPKELHRLYPGRSLIDFSLEHVGTRLDVVEKVVVVVSPGKESVAKYVEKKVIGQLTIKTVQFNNDYKEWPGSIRSAEQFFGDRNVVILPDSVLTTIEGEILSERFSAAFDSGSDIVFAYKKEMEPKKLMGLGALEVFKESVLKFCDKPCPDVAHLYNSYWAAFGFKHEAADSLIELMHRSVSREPVDIAALKFKISAFPISDYTDLGTWPAIFSFLGSTNISRISL